MSRARNRPWGLWATALVALVGVCLGASGYVMAGSFTASNPEPLAHWRRMAAVYGGVAMVSLAVLAAAGVLIVRRARGSRASAPAV